MTNRLSRTGVCVIVATTWCLALDATAQSGPVPSADLGVIRCSATAVAPIVRSEGTSELVGDILITCHNSAPSAGFEPRGFVEADLQLTLAVSASNRVDFGAGSDVSNAVLVINEKHCSEPRATQSFTECGTGNATVQDPTFGRRVDRRTIQWTRFALPIPGAAIGSVSTPTGPVADCSGRYGQRGGCHPLTTTIRLTNLRANVAELRVVGESGSGALPIEASLSIRAADATVQIDGSQLQVAQAVPGILAAATAPDAGRLCSHGDTVAEVTVSEGFASAFKGRGAARSRVGDPGWAAAFYPGTVAGGALPATRIRLSLSNLPDAVQVSVPNGIACSTAQGRGRLELGLVTGADARGEGGSASSGQSGQATIRSLGDTAAVAVYEVLREDPFVTETCRIPVEISRPQRSSTPMQSSEVRVALRLAPVSADPDSASGGTTQRFVDSNPLPRSTFELSSCGTSLFFPFVTNRSNFDTAIVIANTSADPLGSRHQPGFCELRYRGSSDAGRAALGSMRTIEVPAGKNLAFTLSSGNVAQGIQGVADFQGYLVADCSFQHAQGFAFVTEQLGGAAILAQGYLAEVVEAGSQSVAP